MGVFFFFFALGPVGDTRFSTRRIFTISTGWITDLTSLRTSIKFISPTRAFQRPLLRSRPCGLCSFGPL